VSVAYVFLHLLPELHEGQHAVEGLGLRAASGQVEIYLVALLGLAAFYGLERLAATARARSRADGGPDSTDAGAFALHIGSFTLYNILIGYLLVHGERRDEFLYGMAMAMHFVVNDQALRDHHKQRYDRFGRWLLAAAVVAGWTVAWRWKVPEPVVQIMVALLAGGVILNVLKEELPAERQSRFWAFVAGLGVYGVLLLAL
jgi:hypothetical protein